MCRDHLLVSGRHDRLDLALGARSSETVLVNLADDLQKWLAHGAIDPEVLPQVREELAAIRAALGTRAPISPIPAIPLPPRPARPDFSRRGSLDRTFDDDEIPF
jgi:hypothetical protein